MIVDAHTHVGVAIEGFAEEPNIYGVRTASVETYLAGYAENGVDACFAFASHSFHICLSGPTQWGIQKLYDALGPEKLMFGSDGGCGLAAITTAYLRRIARLKAPEEHKAMILGGNAMRFLFGDGWEGAVPPSPPGGLAAQGGQSPS